MQCDLLFELGTEELPSGAVLPLSREFSKLVVSGLISANIQHGEIYTFATPRRLAVLIHDVQTMCDAQTRSRRGPAVSVSLNEEGSPLPALLGFAKSCGVTVSELTRIKTDKGEWWAYEAVDPPKQTKDLLPQIIQDAIKALNIAKPMRWGSGEVLFARPVHWAMLLFGDEEISFHVLGVASGRNTYGHRFHHPEAIPITNPKAYESLLKAAFVVADFEVRRQQVVDLVQQQAKRLGAIVVMPEALVDEVTSIVEWPKALLANFDEAFLEIPAEALIAAMQQHQKCFSLRDTQGHLLPHFITVANLDSTHPEQVIQGNEKVMRARLSDAAFFFRQDQKQPLSQYDDATTRVIFQAGLGSLHDKMLRILLMMGHLVLPLQLSASDAKRAATLSKCDLMTGMVGEFPELQGIMGGYYALHDGENPAVALAIKEQYLPRFAKDELPTSPLGLALSLADRLDTLVGSWAMGQKPTGDKDPFKLRRHALALVRLLLSTPAKLNLSSLLHQALAGYGEGFKASHEISGLKQFILERLQSHYQAEGISSSLIQAVCLRQDDWLFDFALRIAAMQTFQLKPEVAVLTALSKRVSHILQHASMNNEELTLSRFKEPSEIALFECLLRVEQEVKNAYAALDYERLLGQMTMLSEPVALFFEQVLVMVDDEVIRKHRLALLTRVQHVLSIVADLSLL